MWSLLLMPVQTVAGAIATGTHGSTLMDGSLSSQVRNDLFNETSGPLPAVDVSCPADVI